MQARRATARFPPQGLARHRQRWLMPLKCARRYSGDVPLPQQRPRHRTSASKVSEFKRMRLHTPRMGETKPDRVVETAGQETTGSGSWCVGQLLSVGKNSPSRVGIPRSQKQCRRWRSSAAIRDFSDKSPWKICWISYENRGETKIRLMLLLLSLFLVVIVFRLRLLWLEFYAVEELWNFEYF